MSETRRNVRSGHDAGANNAAGYADSFIIQVAAPRKPTTCQALINEMRSLSARLGLALALVDGDFTDALASGHYVYVAGPYGSESAAVHACTAAGLVVGDACLVKSFSLK